MSVQVSVFSLASSAPGQTLCCTLYQPETPPWMSVTVAHGMCEHRQRYHAFAHWLASQGCAVVTYDHLGHGDTAGSAVRLGFFAPHQGWRRLMDDLLLVLRHTGELFPQAPLVLLAHSMGSIVARCTLPEAAPLLKGCVLMGTTGNLAAYPAGVMLSEAIIRQKGHMYRSHLLEKLAFFSYNRHCHPHRTPSDWLSREEWEVDRYRADPRCTFVFTASAFRDLFTLVGRSLQPETFRLPMENNAPGGLPLLLLSGNADPVGSYGKGPRWVARQYRRAGLEQVKVTLYPGARHELLHETNRRQVCEDILAFLREVAL